MTLMREMLSKTTAERQNFDLPALEFALTELGRRAYEAGRTVEIAIYGGAALLLALNRQIGTRDVDAVFEKDQDFVRRLTAATAAEFGWDDNWLDDGVKGWLSARDAEPRAKALLKTYPSEDQPGFLRSPARGSLRHEVQSDAHRRHRLRP